MRVVLPKHSRDDAPTLTGFTPHTTNYTKGAPTPTTNLSMLSIQTKHIKEQEVTMGEGAKNRAFLAKIRKAHPCCLLAEMNYNFRDDTYTISTARSARNTYRLD